MTTTKKYKNQNDKNNPAKKKIDIEFIETYTFVFENTFDNAFEHSVEFIHVNLSVYRQETE